MNGAAHVLEDPQGRERRSCSALSIALHWTIAALIFLQMALGWYMVVGRRRS